MVAGFYGGEPHRKCVQTHFLQDSDREKAPKGAFSLSESWVGFEPTRVGFANRCVNRFATRTLIGTLYHLKLTKPSKYAMISATAGMMKLVDMQHLNCCGATRAGSIPAPGTRKDTFGCFFLVRLYNQARTHFQSRS